MRKLTLFLITLGCLGWAAADVMAQPGGDRDRGGRERGGRERGERGERDGRGFGRGGPGEPGGRGGPGEMMKFLPVLAALDADKDGEISSKEIENAAAALKTLDKNNDGKLTEEEVRPEFGRGGRGLGGPGGPGGPEGRGGRGGIGGRGGDDSAAMVKRLMNRDENDDNKLSKDEVPERMSGMFDRADTDKDGFLTEKELTAVFQRRFRGQGQGRRQGRDGDEDRPRRPQRPE